MHGQRSIGPVDTMWLNMDRPNNLMVIDSVMWFEETIKWELLGPLLQRRLLDRYPVFSQRPVPPSNLFELPRWEDDPDFDLSRHLRRVTLPVPGTEEALQRYVESRMSAPFDRTYPLWEMTLVEGYGGGCALVSRSHHSLADGLALSQVLLSLTNASPTVAVEEAEAQETSSPRPSGFLGAARTLLEAGGTPLPCCLTWPTRPWPGTCCNVAGGPDRSSTSCCWATTRSRSCRASQGLTSGRSGPARERSPMSSG